MTPEQQTAALLKCQDAIERLENENMAMREAIKEAYVSLEWATRTMNPPFEWEPFTRANVALAKLQPFLKP